MKYINRITAYFVLCFILAMCIDIGPAFGLSNEEIFRWVSRQLKIEGKYPMPRVNFVSLPELQAVFKKRSTRSIKRLTAENGEKKAEEILGKYLRDVIGLFVPETEKLYVGRFLKPFQRKAIVAHEFTHYFQLKRNGPVDPESMDAAMKHLFNEMQASKVEKEFKEVYAGDFNQDGKMISLLKEAFE
jgi:hypothetical protein